MVEPGQTELSWASWAEPCWAVLGQAGPCLAGLGPWITLFDTLPAMNELHVDLKINRDGQIIFDQQTSGAEMARSFEDLVGWLSRDNSMPSGAFLMTGTEIVPSNDFTLQLGDLVHISIAGIGTLSNPIVQA